MPVSFLDRLQIDNGLISAQLDNVVSTAMIIYLCSAMAFRARACLPLKKSPGAAGSILFRGFGDCG